MKFFSAFQQFVNKFKITNLSLRKKAILYLLLLTFSFFSGLWLYLEQAHHWFRQESKILADRMKSEIIDSYAEIETEISNELSLYQSNGLPTFYVDLPFSSEMALSEKKNEAFQAGVLISNDEDYVSANVSFMEGDSVDAEVRLKGDWLDHLEGKKYSLRIRLEDDAYIEGMSVFSIQAPETRMFLNEWAFHENLAYEDIMTTRYEFVNVIINGKNKGIYALEEHFGRVLIEDKQRRQGVLIRFDDDAQWLSCSLFSSEDLSASSALTSFTIWSADIDSFETSYILSNEVLAIEEQFARSGLYSYQRGIIEANEILDVEKFGMFLAISDLWQASHSNLWANLCFYYNPVSGLLEPVVYDGDAFMHSYVISFYGDFVGTPILNDPLIREEYEKAVMQITSPEYIQGIKEMLWEESLVYQNALEEEYEGVSFSEGTGVHVPWDLLAERAAYLRLEIIY